MILHLYMYKTFKEIEQPFLINPLELLPFFSLGQYWWRETIGSYSNITEYRIT